MCFAREERGVDKVVLKGSVWAMFMAHGSVAIVKNVQERSTMLHNMVYGGLGKFGWS